MNNRFLVHFFDSGDIYAFHPNSDATTTNNWACVVDSFYKRWTHPVAVSGNILFFHVFMLPYLVIAYDLSADEWFEIVADLSRVDATVRVFDDMFILPEDDDVLCLASGVRATSSGSDSDSAPLGNNALDYQSYDIPIPLSTVCDFLVL